MSVGRLTGSGPDAARGNGARRARAERPAAERTAAERTAAESAAAEPTPAKQPTARRAAAESTPTEQATTERTTAKRAAAERATAERAAAESTSADRGAAERARTERTTADRAAAESSTAEPATAQPATAEGATAEGAAGAAARPGRPARRNAEPASNVVVVGSQTGPAAPATSAPVADSGPVAVPDGGLFARYTREYVSGRDKQQVTILEAGCTTAGDDLGVGDLRRAGADIVVSLLDDDQPVTSAAIRMDDSLADCVQGDLRRVPLPPRSQDIVLCALLLQRIHNAELVLDRLVAAIRPGGLLLLHFGDRDSAAGFLDRVLPSAARRPIWSRRRPGRPGPYPAVYERLSSARGVQAYALKRELVIAERRALGGLDGTLTGPPGFLPAQKLIAWFSRGRLTAAHEELLYVLRKPEDRFARIL